MEITGHKLVLDPNKILAQCECGEPLEGTTYNVITKRWAEHVALQGLFDSMVDAVRREHEARVQSERLILEVLSLGVPTRKISEAIGVNGDGKPIMSATTVQRIARERAANPDKAPRRRKKAESK